MQDILNTKIWIHTQHKCPNIRRIQKLLTFFYIRQSNEKSVMIDIHPIIWVDGSS